MENLYKNLVIGMASIILMIIGSFIALAVEQFLERGKVLNELEQRITVLETQ